MDRSTNRFRLASIWLLLMLLVSAGAHVFADSGSDCLSGPDRVADIGAGGPAEHHCEPGDGVSRLGNSSFVLASFVLSALPLLLPVSNGDGSSSSDPCAAPAWRGASCPWTQRVGLRLYA